MTRDQFAEMVEDMFVRHVDCSCNQCLSPQIIALLRRYHNQVRRAVKKQKSLRSCVEIETMTAAQVYDRACDDILALLERMRNGN